MTTQIIAILLSLCAAAAQTGAGYEYPVDNHSVREAYFLGRTSDGVKLAKFMGQYVRRFPLPDEGAHVAEIEFRTPYAQVVLRSSQNSVGYSAQQAQKDYAAQPDVVVVRVVIYLTPTYQAFVVPPSRGKPEAVERPENFWYAFQFRVSQEHAIKPKKLSGRPIYSSPSRAGLSGSLTGAEVLLKFDAAEFEARSTRVEVTAPDGRSIAADFDLASLR